MVVREMPFVFPFRFPQPLHFWWNETKGRKGRRCRQTHEASPSEINSNKNERNFWEERQTHISTESFKCQLCLLSILLEFLLWVVLVLLELLELPARCMKLMLYHFFDFSNEFSCGFTDGRFGLFSACGRFSEPSQFGLMPSHFSITSHSTFAAVLSTSSVPSGPAEFFNISSDCVTSSPIFNIYLISFPLFTLVFRDRFLFLCYSFLYRPSNTHNNNNIFQNENLLFLVLSLLEYSSHHFSQLSRHSIISEPFSFCRFMWIFFLFPSSRTKKFKELFFAFNIFVFHHTNNFFF